MRANAEGGEGGVVDVLTRAGLWGDPSVWRDLGDDPENYSTVGSQQSRAEQALVEKLVNSIDTKLIASARGQGIKPDGEGAPQSVFAARDLLFGDRLSDLDALARSITVAATGSRSPGRMCLSITDDGEGQTPTSMPRTILSVLKGSKKRIPFVQGKFHMGGTGVLEFCGRDHNLQFVLSKRNPGLLQTPPSDEFDAHWSFTVIRRDDPEPGGVRSSRFKYLAPGIAGPDGDRALLHFAADKLAIFPDKSQAYAREAGWGTLFKLYEYDTRLKGNIILRDGLMMRVRIMLPEPALPIRFHECREGFRGHTGSFDTTMKGLIGTLDDDRKRDEARRSVEWFDRFELNVDGEPFLGRIYLFKDGKSAEAYRQSEGVLFTYNGQTHAIYTKDFFRRASVKQDYLWQSLLIFVDCSQISARAHEKLFMASRDRLRDGQLKRELEEALEDALRTHPKLKEIAAQRRDRERAEQPEVSETFRKFLEDMLKRNPALAALLGPGFRIANPHKPLSVVSEERPWEGERFPTRFHFKGHANEDDLRREAYLNSQVRFTMETDAEDDYFSRDEQPGTFRLLIQQDGEWIPAKNWKSPSLAKGVAHFSLALPPETAVGERIVFEAVIDDPSRVEPFRNRVELTVKPERLTVVHPPSPTPTPKPPSGKPGQDREQHGFLDVPEPLEVSEDRWALYDPPFDKWTAMVIKAQPNAPEGSVAYDYFVNMDNVYLQAALKHQPKQSSNLRAQFKLGMAMVALAVVQHDLTSRPKIGAQGEDTDRGPWEVSDQVKLFTSAMAPFLLPMVSSLAKLPEDQPEALSLAAGEEAA